MLKRLVLVVLLVLMAVPVISAQDTTVFCGDLSADDCGILQKSSDMMNGIESIAFAFDMAMDMAGLEALDGPEEFTIGMGGDGAFSFSLASFDAMDISGMFTKMQGELSLALALPEELMEPGMPELSFELILVDGVIYVDAGPLMGMPGSMWMGMELAPLIDMAMAQTGDMTGDMMATDDMSMLDESTYTTIERLDDEEVMGQTVAVFESTLDFGAMFSDEAFQEMFSEIMTASMAMQGLPMDTLEPTMDLIVGMFADSTISMTQSVGLDDYYVHRFEMYMYFNLDMATFAAFAEGASMPDGTLEFVFDGGIDLHDFNEPLDIQAPEGAEIIDLFGMLGAGF